MMAEYDLELLAKLGIHVTSLERECTDPSDVFVHGTFEIDEEQFRPMCHLIRLVDMVCESKNPAVNETFNHLVTMLELTKESK